MDITISSATQAHVPELVSLVNGAYRGEGSKAGWTTEADLLDGQRTDAQMLSELLAKENNTILIGTDETNRILGCVYLQQTGAVMYLGMLTVQPKLQAQGIGRRLMAGAEKFATEKHCTSIEMTVISVRHELIAWYNKLGYQPTGASKPFPPDSKFGIAKQPLEFIVVSKTL
ncbi:MAG TPA: GNAT family N-acetyltransferase [Chitinophagaceae bacterium]|nr:GNAT family N-acetyltransferase [Chitinophagaceae bacterium]